MTDFILPDIGEGIVECELVEWLVAEGDQIQEDQPVADVMTDKALVQIPAMHTGVVKKLYYKKGDIAKVHEPLFAMDIQGQVSVDEQVEVAPEPVTDTPAATAGKVIEDFILPDIGEGIVECELVEWLIAEGDDILEDQPVADVMTDKALVQIPAKHSGKVTKLYYAKGDIAQVHTPLFAQEINAEGTSATAVPQVTAQTVAPVAEQVKAPVQPVAGRKGKALASPAVRRVARELGVDIQQVPGSGKKGRVMKEDVVAFSQGNAQAPAAIKETSSKQVSTAQVFGGKRTEPIRGVQAAMAKQMTSSVFTIPHFSVSEEVEMDNLMAVRQQLKPEFEKQGLKLSFMPFIIKALSMALKQFPVINSQVNEDCTEITYFDDHNIGMAVDSKIGLLVPNIKGVQNLSLLEITREANRIIDLAREGRLSGDDLKGGTISISNVGVIGGTTATPVINKPEAAIVALGKIQRLPRFDENDNVKAVNIMHVSWSGDHRIIDGATLVRFNNLWKSYLENPVNMLSELR